MASNFRMPNINRYCVGGRLTRDPELRYTANNVAMCSFQIAWSYEYKNRGGDAREEKLFLTVKCFRQTAEFVGEHLRKGRPVYCEGRLITDEWEKDGKRQSHTRLIADTVQCMDWPDDGRGPAQTKSAAKPVEARQEEFDDDADIPF